MSLNPYCLLGFVSDCHKFPNRIKYLKVFSNYFLAYFTFDVESS